MALFSRNKEKEETKAGTKKTSTSAPTTATAQVNRDLSAVIVKPHITEKAVKQGEQNVYTFIVHKDATKYDVRDAVIELFKVTPVKVNIVNKSPRTHMSRMRGRRISHKGQKKAYVYLTQGDSIELA